MMVHDAEAVMKNGDHFGDRDGWLIRALVHQEVDQVILMGDQR